MKRIVPSLITALSLVCLLFTATDAKAQAPTVGSLSEVVVEINNFTVEQHGDIYTAINSNNKYEMLLVCVPANVMVVDASNSGLSGQAAYSDLMAVLTGAGIDAGNITIRTADNLANAKNECANTRGQ